MSHYTPSWQAASVRPHTRRNTGVLGNEASPGLVVGDGYPKNERVFLDPVQVRKLIAALPEPCRSIVLALALTGLRVGELLALRRKHLDFSAGVIRVRETVYEGQFGSPKARSSRRDVPMSQPVREVLLRLSANAEPDVLVFRSRAGTPINPKNLANRVLRPECRELKLPVIGWHSFPHTRNTTYRSRRVHKDDSSDSRSLRPRNNP